MMKTVIISLGGSLIVPDEIDVSFLKKFKVMIEEYISQGYKFVIYCGGGSVARKYQKAYSSIVDGDQEVMDWLGISATHLNSQLVKSIFYENSEDEVLTDPNQVSDLKKNILVCGGWKPGWSTDYDAVIVAKKLDASILINLSNIDYAYDKDPKKFDDAKKLEEVNWADFRKIVGDIWKPGLNMPFDPIASKEAEKFGLKVVIAGKDLDNLRNIIEGKEFKGTLVK